jgi:DNA-binding transcriptional MerR regulator
MFTITQLARSCGLSRGAILHYESMGLLKPSARSSGNYRRYSEKDQAQLRQICLYRSAGLALMDIRELLGKPVDDVSGILRRRFAELDAEIEALRGHQRVILTLLKTSNSLMRLKPVTKEKWIEIMKRAGFSDDDMHRWHREFERAAPEDHHHFLEFLNIPAEEIVRIREWSRGAASRPDTCDRTKVRKSPGESPAHGKELSCRTASLS